MQGVQGQVRAEPMALVSGNERYTLRFDCKPCEMHVIGAIKPGILNSPPPRWLTPDLDNATGNQNYRICRLRTCQL